jgi:hypothetical protein
MCMVCYAHTAWSNGSPDPDERQRQPLHFHLQNVAALADRFAAPFNLGDEAELVGLLDDLGKYAHRFQARLRDPAIHGINHWAAGAAYAAESKQFALEARDRSNFADLAKTS